MTVLDLGFLGLIALVYGALHLAARRVRQRDRARDPDGADRRRPRRLPVRLAALGLVSVVAGGSAIVAGDLSRPAPAHAYTVCPGETRPLIAYNYEAVTVAATAIGFTASTITGTAEASAQAVHVSVETAQIRYRIDGTDPTAAEGHVKEAGDSFYVCGTSVSKFKAIRTTGTSATLRVTFLRRG